MYEQTDGIVQWRKSDRCSYGPDCVEVAMRPDGTVGVRDSKDPGGPVLEFTGSEWTAFLAGVRAGQFDEA
jgi:Domain of unknown function (DUF397)